MSLARFDLLAPPLFAAAGLLLVSGLAKLRHPKPVERALASVRVPSSSLAVRAIGLVEVIVGSWCLFAPGRASIVSLALLYAAFATFLALQIKARVPGASCGCLGRHEVPASLLHVALNGGVVGAAIVSATAPPEGIVSYAARLPLGGLAFLMGTALLAYLAYLVVAYLPRMFWSYERSRDEPAMARPARFAIGRVEDR